MSKNYPEVHPSSLRPVENMVAMEELSEAAILHNLRLRFTDNLIYTHISSILVSINPFKQLPIYGPAIMKEYRDKLVKMERVAPHVYSLADAAFTNLRNEGRDQSVIISGESGAGKTEATKSVAKRHGHTNSMQSMQTHIIMGTLRASTLTGSRSPWGRPAARQCSVHGCSSPLCMCVFSVSHLQASAAVLRGAIRPGQRRGAAAAVVQPHHRSVRQCKGQPAHAHARARTTTTQHTASTRAQQCTLQAHAR